MAWPDDPISLPDFVSGLVNAATLQLKLTTRLNALVARVGVTGPQSTGVVPTDNTGATTGANLNTITAQQMIKAGPDVSVYVTVQLKQAIAGTTSGNVTNTPVAILPAPFRPVSLPQPLSSGGSGPMCQFVVYPTGVVQLVATGPGYTIPASTVPTPSLVSFGGKFIAL